MRDDRGKRSNRHDDDTRFEAMRGRSRHRQDTDFDDLDSHAIRGRKIAHDDSPDRGAIKANSEVIAIGQSQSLTAEQKLEQFSFLIRRGHLLDSVRFATLAYQLQHIRAVDTQEWRTALGKQATALANRGVENVYSFKSRDLASSMFCLSGLQTDCPEFFMQGTRAATERLKNNDTNLLDIIELCCAVSRKDFRSAGIPGSEQVWNEFWLASLPVIEKEMANLDLFHLTRLTTSLNAASSGNLSTLPFRSLTKSLCSHMNDRLNDSSILQIEASYLPTIVQSFTEANRAPRGAFSKLGDLSRELLPALEIAGIADIVWNFGRMNFYHPLLIADACKEISKRQLPSSSGNACLKMAWAFAVSNHYTAFDFAWKNVERLAATTTWSDDDLSRLIIAADAMGKKVPVCLEKKITDHIHKVSNRIGPDYPEIISSDFHLSVERTLTELGINFKHEVPLDGHIYTLDILIPELNGRPTVVECNGIHFHHVGADPKSRHLGKTVLKTRCLENRGYNVIHIDNSTWGMAIRNGTEKELVSRLLSMPANNHDENNSAEA